MSDANVILTQNLIVNFRKRFGKSKTVKAVDGINLNIKSGIIFGLLGPSGCGKSTLLSCILGLVKPTCGSVMVYNKAPSPGPFVGYMPQAYSLPENCTALELLKYYSLIFQVRNCKEKIKALLRRLHIFNGDVEQRKISSLSGREKRRVSLACTLIHEPKLLLL